MKLVVDRDRCTGIGICESIVPEVFEVDDDGTLHVATDASVDDARLEEAVRACPALALALVRESPDE